MLYFIGLGISEKGLSVEALEILRRVDSIFLELYTSIIPGFKLNWLESVLGRRIRIVDRKSLEEREGEDILRQAEVRDVALLVPGDPFIATTHIVLRIEAEKRGIKTRIIHAPSIITAAFSASGLQIYKIGKIVTITIPEPSYKPITPYIVLKENLKRGLHTLFLLEVRADTGEFLSIPRALSLLEDMGRRVDRRPILDDETLVIGLARVGSPSEYILVDSLARLKKAEFGPPPHSLIIPGVLHPVEEEALTILYNCRLEVIENWRARVRSVLRNT